jgi:DNA-binding NarL/FixJ family response regulator
MHVLIVDDHPLFRAGLKALLYELDPNIETREAATVAEACAAHNEDVTFGLVLLDMKLPDGNGLDVLRRVKELFDEALVVIMSATEDPHLIRSAIDMGACGYIPKTTNPAVAVNALRLVLAKGIYLPLNILKGMAIPGAVLEETQECPRPSLSERQLAVLQRLLQGKPNKIIARELAIAEGTVKAHLASIYQFLKVTTRSQAMSRAHQLGFFEQFSNLPRVSCSPDVEAHQSSDEP